MFNVDGDPGSGCRVGKRGGGEEGGSSDDYQIVMAWDQKPSHAHRSKARHVETWRTLVSLNWILIHFLQPFWSNCTFLADLNLFPYFSVDVTPRKKHKKDKHKSGEEESGSV